MRDRFPWTDECKPVDGGRRILITSSGHGAALVERGDGRAVFWAEAKNAHSADVLPGGRIVVAASVWREGGGDRLILFNAAGAGRELWTESFPHAHGIVWDPERSHLWALGHDELRGYALSDWESEAPALRRTSLLRLPEAGGHDLSPMPGTPKLIVTTERHVWLFDRDSGGLAPHPELGGAADVKCVSVHPATGRTAFVQAESPNWWAHRVRFLSPEGELALPGENVYKARWLAATH
jgi:hypothetical protein